MASGRRAVVDQYKVVIRWLDETHQSEVREALDQNDLGRLAELLWGADARALVG